MGLRKESEKEGAFIAWFSELSNKDVAIAGGKGASLAEMYNTKMPIPPGFVVTAQAYSYFVSHTHLKERIADILTHLDVNDTKALNKASKQIREMIEGSTLPKELEEAIVEAYEILNVAKNEKVGTAARTDAHSFLDTAHVGLFVAVRSSATTEDLADASFAGQQDTFLNVRGIDELLENVKKCMSSLFTARAIYYRTRKGFDHAKAYLAVVVQKMVNSTKSGVIFSKNPTTNDNSIVIEAVWGLGEGIVSGQIKPDHYVVADDLSNFTILESQINEKKIAIVRNKEGKNETIKLDDEKSHEQVLSVHEIKRLAQYSRELEAHYKKPQDIEFALEGNEIYIVQSRPITTVFKEHKKDIGGTVLLTGLGASPGVSSGVVRIVHDLSELEKVKEGDVLVTEMTNPDMVVSMQKAAAIVTDEGGITSHAAIVSREMGIPAVVGTGHATKTLKEGQIISVDGSSGNVYEGRGETKLVEIEPIVPTKTEIKVIVDLPGFAQRAALSKARAVGLMRLEGIIASSGKHPIGFVQKKRMKEYTRIIATGIREIMKPFEEAWIRTSDIRSDEYQHLEGAPQHVEGNPMLGDHGIRFSLKHQDILVSELSAIKEVALDFPQKTLGIMMPQIISVDELRKTKEIASKIGMPKNVMMGIMVETPAAVQIIEELCHEGIAFISFGTNDLTQYTLAIDRNNEAVQDIYNEMHPAVLNSLRHVIRICRRYGVKTSICGQAGSREDMVRFLVSEGIESISVNADAARKVSELVARIEGEAEKGKKAHATMTLKIIRKDTRTPEMVATSISRLDARKRQEELLSYPEARAQALALATLFQGFSNGDKDGFVQIPLISEDSWLQLPLPEQTSIDGSAHGESYEDLILKALDSEEYSSGKNSENKKDIPPINDAIPIDSEMFQDAEKLREWDGEDQ